MVYHRFLVAQDGIYHKIPRAFIAGPAIGQGVIMTTEEKAIKKLEKMMEPYKSRFAWYLLVHLRSRCRVDPALAAGILQESKSYEGCYCYINKQLVKIGGWQASDLEKFQLAEEYFRKPEKLMVDNKINNLTEEKPDAEKNDQKIVFGEQMSLFDYMNNGKIDFGK